ncbi:MAG: hypothetical protein ACLVA2_02495 [Clostridia bacterium]
MREEDIDIVEMIIERMPEQTKEQYEIKLYMKRHKSNCNYYIYKKYKEETRFFNTILKSLMLDLGQDIITLINKDNIIETINK